MSSGRGLLRGVSRLQLLVAGLVIAGGVGLTAFAGSIVVAVMTVGGALGGGTSLWVLLALLLTVLASGVAVAAAAAWLAWIGLAQLRTAVESTHRRLLFWAYQRTRAFEADNTLGRVLRPSRVFATGADREGPLVTELKQRYVAGELDEPTFEQELGRLLGEGADVGQELSREIEVTAADGGAGSEDARGGDDDVSPTGDATSADASEGGTAEGVPEYERT